MPSSRSSSSNTAAKKARNINYTQKDPVKPILPTLRETMKAYMKSYLEKQGNIQVDGTSSSSSSSSS